MKIKNIMHYKGYRAKAEYSVDDQMFYGRVLGLTDMVDFYAESAKDVEKEFHTSVDEYLAFCAQIGKEPQKEYSGTFNVRISPELHRQAVLKAETEGVSLNKVTEKALAQYCSENRMTPVFIVPEFSKAHTTLTLSTSSSNTYSSAVYQNAAYIGGNLKC